MGIQDRGLKLYPVEEHTQLYLIAEYRCGFIWKCREMAAHKMRVTYAFLITVFRYFINVFHSFPFPKGCRLKKGHVVPILCSQS